MRNVHRDAEARANGIFRDVSGEMRGAQAGGNRQPGERFEFVIEKKSIQAPRRMFGVSERRVAAIVEDDAEELGVLLVEAVQARLEIIFRDVCAKAHLAAGIRRSAMLSSHDWVGERAVIVGAIVMIEGRYSQQRFRIERVNPGEVHQCIGFMIAVALIEARVLPGQLAVDKAVFNVERKRVVRNLVVVLTQRCNEAQLIRGIDVKNQRSEAAVAIGCVVYDLRHRSLNSQIAAIAVDAGVIGEPFGVAAEAEGIVGLIEISGAQYNLCFIVPLESGARHDVEDSIGAISKIRAVAAAAHLEIVDVLGIKLRSKVRRDVGVGNRHAIDQPTRLVSAANVQLIVREIRSRHVIRDHGETVGPVRSRRLSNIEPADQRGRSRRVGRRGYRSAGYCYRFLASSNAQGKMHHWLRARNYDHLLLSLLESWRSYADYIFSQRYGVEIEVAVAVGIHGRRPVG